MTHTKWKPTHEMLAIAYDGYNYDGDYVGMSSLEDALIAVQPLIAAEERERIATIMGLNDYGYGPEIGEAIRALKQEKNVKP